MKKLMICSLSIILLSCSAETTIFGVYKNEKGEKVTIDCDYRITSDKLEGQFFMPDNGDKISLSTNKMDATEFEMDYMAGDTMQSAFGKWDRSAAEITINGIVYSKKEELSCNK